jgi:preprotein translocase subunit SecD
MKKLQTILITGSLPVKLNIAKSESISPVLGTEFFKSALIMTIVAILAVTIIIFIAYRTMQIVIPIMFTMVSEVIILLGIASLIGWNLDIASIAGIIVAVGTGVDSQIVITDEILHGEQRRVFGWKEKIKNAFFIIMGAYLTVFVSMIPLFSAGAGLLKGFALTTIIGISVGVFITRPAYAATAEMILKK